MKRLILLLLLLPLPLVTLTSCGPVIGQVMSLSEGTRIEQVVAGSIKDLKIGSRLLVFGPFAKTPQAFYICRGEDAATFAEIFRDKGFFKTDLTLLPGFEDTTAAVSQLKRNSPETIRKELGLATAPDLVLFGTILNRSINVAPTVGVIQDVTYRLEFYNPQTGTATIIDVRSKQDFQDCIPAVIDALLAAVSD